MNTQNSRKFPGVIHREYKDSDGNSYTEYKDSKGNIHTEYTEPQKNTTAYNNGYVEGNLANEQRQDIQESRTDKNVSKGLLIGVIVTCVAGLTAGTIYFLTKHNDPEPAPVVIMPTSQTNPKATQPSPQIRVVEKPVVTIVKVPVPQDQSDKATVNITTNPPVSNPSAKPIPVAVIPAAKPIPVVVTPAAKPLPVAVIPTVKPIPVAVTPAVKPIPVVVTPTVKPEPIVITSTAPTDTNAVNPTPIKSDRDLKTEILKEFKDNLPNNQLMVEVKNGDVMVSGTTTTLEQLQQIQPLLKSIEGIGKIELKVTVAPTM